MDSPEFRAVGIAKIQGQNVVATVTIRDGKVVDISYDNPSNLTYKLAQLRFEEVTHLW